MITNAAWSPFRPPRPACWLNSQVSLGRPGQFLFNTLDPDTSYPYQCWRWERCQGRRIPYLHTWCWWADGRSLGRKMRILQMWLARILPSCQGSQNTLLFLVCVVTTELFNRRRVKAGKPKWPSLLLCPGCWWGWMQPSKMMHIIWSFLTDWLLRISSLDLTPMVSAVSFLSTNTCTLILALLSASKGKTKLSTRSMFL